MKKVDVHTELQEILSRLKPFEAEVVSNYLVAFDRKQKGKPNKSLVVFEKMLATPDLSYDSLKSMVSPELNKYDFNKFLSRLRDKIFDSLLIDLNIHRKDSYSAWFRARQECTKKWVLIVNLIGRGNEASAIQLLREQIKKCEQYELFDLLASALRISLNIEGLSQGPSRFKEIQQKLVAAEKSRDAVYRSLEWYTRYFMVADRKSSQNEQVGILMEALSELQSLYKETNAAEVGRYALTLEMEYHETMGDYNAVQQAGRKLVDLIENSAALKSDIRLANAYANLAFNDLLLHHFDSALNNIELSFKGLGQGSYNHIVVTTLKAQVHYFNTDFDAAYDIAETMLQSKLLRIAPYEKCKLQYLKGSLLFNDKKYFKAYNEFNSENILMESDPEGWNIGIRIMCILCLIEMQLNDLADLSIESLRKHISRKDKERFYQPRDKAILKILRSLERNSFDFAKTYFKNQELFFKLQSNHPDYQWKIKSHEQIVFHDWFQSKLAEEPYRFHLPEVIELEKAELKETK